MKKVVDDEIEEKLKYLGLDLNNIPDFLQKKIDLEYNFNKQYGEKNYKVYRYVNVNDITILLTQTNRLVELKEKIEKAQPIIKFITEESQDDIERFIPLGVRFQINAYSLARLFPKKHLLDWIASGRVVALGSDIHGEDKAAYRKFNKAQLRFDNMIKHLSDASNEIWQRTKEF